MTQSIPEDTKQCNRCKQFLPLSTYTSDKTKKDGLRTICKVCTKTPKPTLPPPPAGFKQCIKCEQIKPATTEFFHATALYQSPDGLNKQCIECRKTYRSALNKTEAKEPRPQGNHKECQVCKEHFPATLEYFHYNKSTKDRLCTRCQECSKAKSVEYRARPGGEEARRIYRASRAENDHQYRKVYREAHREHETQYRKAYRQLHSDHERAYRKAYLQRPGIAEIMSARYHRRRARKMGTEGAYTSNDVKGLYQAQRGRCYYCGTKFHKGKYAYHVDHVIPLSRGGSNSASNIVLSCAPCNLRKGSKLLHEWTEGGRLL